MELKACCKERFEPVVQAIRQLQKEKEGLDEPLIVAIDGRCGSGKTTLGEYLEDILSSKGIALEKLFIIFRHVTFCISKSKVGFSLSISCIANG